ncbi:MAG: hypothetical protein H7Z75_16795, partial [Ferruginibacter sp.]|nr:hypothetical protein [Cytophagales bacterium]
MNQFHLTQLLRRALLLSLAGACFNVYGQKEANVWHFGDRAGLDFNQCKPSPVAGSMASPNGCAVISHPKTGQLLFYSNARQVFNRNHRLMPHGDSL